MKKMMLLLIAVCLILSGCSAKTKPASSEKADDPGTANTETTLTDISCLYYPGADPDPILSRNLTNRKLLDAVYLPLVTFDETLDITGGCAESYKAEGDTLRFSLDTNRKFSDGSALTGEAVAACFNRAMKDETSPYHAQLQNVESVTAAGNFVTVTLKEQAPGAVYTCCIPVAKQGKDGKFLGCGNYFIGRKNGMNVLLPSKYAKPEPTIDVIYLQEPKETSELTGMFNSGVLDVLPTDLLEDNTFSASRNYDIASCLQNRMLYLGVNDGGNLSSAALRRAFSMLIPRDDIVKNVLMGLGKATARPFYPAWNALPEESLTYEEEKIVKAFVGAGWKDAGGKLMKADGQKIRLSLLIEESDPAAADAAERIKAAATARGITVTVETEPHQAFDRRLLRGDFDLFLRWQDLPLDLDPGALFCSDGTQNYGGVKSASLDRAYADWRRGSTDAKTFCDVFAAEMPLIPVAFSAQTVYLTKGLRHDMKMSYLCPLGNLAEWQAN